MANQNHYTIEQAKVTLKVLVFVSMLMMTIVSFGFGLLWDRIGDNSTKLETIVVSMTEQQRFLDTKQEQLRAEVENAIAMSSEFHTEQRVRIWNRMNENETIVNKIDNRLSVMEGSIDNLDKNVDRILNIILIDNNRKGDRDGTSPKN